MKVGFIGTGLMGLPMAQRLIEAKLEVVVYNRTTEKLRGLRGAAIASSPAEVLQASNCVILMLTDAHAIASVLLSESSRCHLQGKTIIQMGTIAPTESRHLAEQISSFGGEYLEAPVLGSIPEAKSGNLIVMVGGTPEQYARWRFLLQNFGPEPKLIGPVGTAAAAKLALNQLIASLTTAFALSLGFVQQQGVEVEDFMQILRNSALYAPTFDKKLQRMLQRDYSNPNFPTKHLLKDTNLFLAEAKSMGLNVSSLDGIRQILEIAVSRGLTDSDYSALFDVVNPPPQ